MVTRAKSEGQNVLGQDDGTLSYYSESKQFRVRVIFINDIALAYLYLVATFSTDVMFNCLLVWYDVFYLEFAKIRLSQFLN